MELLDTRLELAWNCLILEYQFQEVVDSNHFLELIFQEVVSSNHFLDLIFQEVVEINHFSAVF